MAEGAFLLRDRQQPPWAWQRFAVLCQDEAKKPFCLTEEAASLKQLKGILPALDSPVLGKEAPSEDGPKGGRSGCDVRKSLENSLTFPSSSSYLSPE